MKKLLIGLLLLGVAGSAMAAKFTSGHSSSATGGAEFTVQAGDTCQGLATSISQHCATITYIGAVGGGQPWCQWTEQGWSGSLQAGATGQYNCQ